ncbi:Zn-dependent hydrolases of the beta-lactamase fold [Hordeum vulgare]|nr:Zn-dependent hydrolases of the beta-lactamase fold [Hordeum vulgare]
MQPQQIQRPAITMAMAGLLLKLLPPQPAPSILSSTSQRRWLSHRRPPPIHHTTTTTRIKSSGDSSSSYAATTPATKTSTTVKLTYLEFNGWLWELPGGFRILVDPILVGNLDFGIPWLFDAAKKTLNPKDADGAALQRLNVDLLLITQSLDDHCHLRTLTKLAAIRPNLPVVTTPNARPILSALPFTDVTYLEPGQSTTAGEVTVLATAGPVLGPPWQRPENGYIVTTAGKSVYYEPHCVYDAGFLRDRALRADVLITPVIKQLLPADFTLVSGQEDAVELAGLLNPSYVVPMSNGEFDAKGLLAALVSTRGTIQAFRAMLADALPDAKVVEPTPGVPLHLCFDDDHDNNNTNSSSSS